MSVVADEGQKGLGPVSNKKVENTGVEEEEMGLLNSFEAAQTQFRLAPQIALSREEEERRGWDRRADRKKRKMASYLMQFERLTRHTQRWKHNPV